MVSRKQPQSLHVSMNGRHVGLLTKKTAGHLTFQYDTAWLARQGARPISLSLPLKNKIYQGDVVYHFFDNLLPDNPEIRAKIQKKFQSVTQKPFDLLASIGRDCVGAIQFTSGEVAFDKTIQAQPLSDGGIARILNGIHTMPLGLSDEQDSFRISIAGVQEKTAFLRYKNSWCYPLGVTPTTHIFKLPMGFIEHHHLDLSDSCENEWLCLHIAKAFGLPVAEAKVHEFENVKALVVERFDRQLSNDKTWLMRLPQEDCCQALGYSPHLKYESDGGPGVIEIMKFLLGSRCALDDQVTFFRSQILFYLLAAIDGHAKNFSVFIEPEGIYHLTPLYDILSAHPLMAKKQVQKQKVKMAMALVGKHKHYHWDKIQRRHFLSTAKAANFSVKMAETFLQDMLDQVEAVITSVSAQLPVDFPQSVAEAVFDGMKQAKNRIDLSG